LALQVLLGEIARFVHPERSSSQLPSRSFAQFFASKFPNWKQLEFYDGSKKLGTVIAAPAQFSATNLTPGYHVFSVLGTDAVGNIRASNPVMVVVRTLAQADQ
jgi:hypothetical protein